METRTLELPVNRPVQFNITSVDVTHGFWPAALGVQVDANPGVTTVIRTTPNKLGSFTVQCSQLCGLYHAFMNNKAAVVTSHAVRPAGSRATGRRSAANKAAGPSRPVSTTTTMSS